MSREIKPYHIDVYPASPPTVSGAPLVCNLTRLFDLDFNISITQITPRQEGFLTLGLSSSRDVCDRGIGYLREKDILASPVVQWIWHNEDKCMQCGMCTALCPLSTLTVDIKTCLLAFDKEKYAVCMCCVRICPVGAMQTGVPEGGVLTE